MKKSNQTEKKSFASTQNSKESMISRKRFRKFNLKKENLKKNIEK